MDKHVLSPGLTGEEGTSSPLTLGKVVVCQSTGVCNDQEISTPFDNYMPLIFLFKSWSTFSFKASLAERTLPFIIDQGKQISAFAFSSVKRTKGTYLASAAWYFSRPPKNKLKIRTRKLLLIHMDSRYQQADGLMDTRSF